MKRKHYLLDLFNGVEDRFVVEAVQSQESARPALRKNRIVLIAAAIALTALLVGCGIVYVLNMQNLKLAENQVVRDRWDHEAHTLVEVTLPQQVLTLSGLKGTPSYQAAQEWYEFKQAYDPDHSILNSIWGNVPEFPKEYDFYNPYTQEMVDKIDQICEKYDLKLMGTPVEAQTSKCMLEYLGIENALLPGAAATVYPLGTGYYEGGYFWTEFDIQMDEGEGTWPFQSLIGFRYSPKDCFNATVYELEGDDWQERTYTTASGHEVLILRSPTYWESWAFCDVGEATVTIRMETIQQAATDQNGYQEIIKTHMTDQQMNEILDTINFDLKPNPGDPAILEGQRSSTDLTQTQNGYTITVEDVMTDGHRTAITLSLTAPEDVDLEQYIHENSFYTGFLGFSNQNFMPISDIAWISGSGGLSPQPDGDGKANTVEFFGVNELNAKEGMAFPKGCQCNLFLDGLYVQAWNEELLQFDTLWTQEGIWNFDITLEEGNWTELEFIDEPITIRAVTGYAENGEDVYEDVTITSLKMRAFGGQLTHTKQTIAKLCDYANKRYPTLVLKDGDTIRLNDELEPRDKEDIGKMIPLDEIDYLQLIDGTKLYPVASGQ